MAWIKSALNVSFLITLCALYVGCHTKIPHARQEPTAEETEVEYDRTPSRPSKQGDDNTKGRPEREHQKMNEDKKKDWRKQAPLRPESDKRSEKNTTGHEAGTVREAALTLAKTLGNIKKAK